MLQQLPEAMLFDLDGTLAHTLPQLSIAISKVVKELNLTPIDSEKMSSFVGNGVNMLIARTLLNRHEVTLDEVDQDLFKHAKERFFYYYQQGLKSDFEIYSGVKEGLEYFHSLGIKLGVVTNKPHVFAEPLIEYMGFKPLFGAILGGEVIDKRKPHADPLFYVLDKLKVNYSKEHFNPNIIMVGDSINDIEAAKNAKVVSVAFTYGYDGGYDIRSCESVDYLFDDFKELYNLIFACTKA